MQSYTEQVSRSIDEKIKAVKVADEAKKRHAKIKGHFITVPDFHPRTEIFVRDGNDEAKAVRDFLARVSGEVELKRGPAWKKQK